MQRAVLPRAITFDTGGTLIQPWPSVGHIYAEAAAEQGFGKISADRLNVQFAGAWKHRQHFDYSRKSWLGLITETFSGLMPEAIAPAFFDALYRRFERPEAWRIFDDVWPTLQELRRRGVRLAIISNWDERLRPLLRALELERFFETLTISHEVGHTKPDSEIFHHAAQALGIPAAAILHVGDSRREDFAGARQAGSTALLLDRARDSRTRDEIVSLKDLIG